MTSWLVHQQPGSAVRRNGPGDSLERGGAVEGKPVRPQRGLLADNQFTMLPDLPFSAGSAIQALKPSRPRSSTPARAAQE